MKRLALLSLVAFAAWPAHAQNSAAPDSSAQSAAEPKVNQLIVYGDDECPESTGDEITVCARLDESERYRIPESLRQLDGPENEAWTNKVKSFETVGAFGPLSCTPVGAGGELGCTAKMIEAAYAEKREIARTKVNMAELVAEARQKRLSDLDEQAAATQARVEAIERERTRLEAQGVPPAEAAAQAADIVAKALEP
jgi:hypothetical protein